MNCRPGDLAQIVKASAPREYDDLGKLVRVISPGPDFSFAGDTRAHWCCESQSGPLWAEDIYVEPPVWLKLMNLSIPDACLKPLRPLDAKEIAELANRTVPALFAEF